jgi:hypothetical protein
MVKMTTEEYLKTVISMFDSVIARYEQNDYDINHIEGEQCDLMHEISLGNKKNVSDAYKIYDRLRNILLKRYKCKDDNKLGNELYDFCKNNKEIQKAFSKMLTNYQKNKKHLENRVYKPRVILSGLTMKQEEISVNNAFADALKKLEGVV